MFFEVRCRSDREVDILSGEPGGGERRSGQLRRRLFAAARCEDERRQYERESQRCGADEKLGRTHGKPMPWTGLACKRGLQPVRTRRDSKQKNVCHEIISPMQLKSPGARVLRSLKRGSGFQPPRQSALTAKTRCGLERKVPPVRSSFRGRGNSCFTGARAWQQAERAA